MLPRLDIQFDNGNITNVQPPQDGIFALAASAVAVGSTFTLNTPYYVKSMQDVAALGIVPSVDNYRLYHALEKFFAEAGDGTKLWLIGFAKSTKPSDWFTLVDGKAPIEKILDAANGEISAVFTVFSPTGYTVNVVNGLDADVMTAKQAAQQLAENYTNNKYAPFFVILEGYGFDGSVISLANLAEGTDNRVAIFVGDTEKRTGSVINFGTATYVLAGRLAKIGVHENAGKVKLGSLETLNAYIVDTAVEYYDVEGLHDKGYVTFRTHVRKTGYFITDDPLATALDDDYHYITRRRTIDKAFRLAHGVAVNELLNDLNITNTGTIDPLYAATIEGAVEMAIYNGMTANGSLSVDTTDPNDLGVKATMDLSWNVINTSKIKMSIKVRPKGQNRWFDILLGFNVNLNA